MNRTKYVIGILVVVLLGMSYAMLTSNLMLSSNTFEGVGYVGMVCPTVTRADGTVEELGCNKNVLTNDGKNHTTKQLFSQPTAAGGNDVVDKMMLGNTSNPVAGSPSHPGNITNCGLTQVGPLVWSMTGTSDGNVTNSTTWTSTCSNLVVNTTGLETYDKVYFAGNNFTSVTLDANDQLTVTWYVWITGT